MSRGAKFSKTAKSDARSVKILKYLIDDDYAYCAIEENDKIPNHDGYIELLNQEGYVLGKIEVQVKTLRQNYKKVSHPINKKYLQYISLSAQLPFVFIVVDQSSEIAYWKHLTVTESRFLLKELKTNNNDSISIEFSKDNQIPDFPPFEKWTQIASDYKHRIDKFEEQTISKELVRLVSKEKSVLDQLNVLFQIVSEDLLYIPVHILNQIRPLTKGNWSYYNNYTLNSDNNDLIDFFNAFKVLDQKKVIITNKEYFKSIRNPKDKLDKILRHLTSNLIYYVNIDKSTFDIRLFHQEKCNCARCQIEKFSFINANFAKEVKDSIIENLMNRAYAHYKVGHFLSAYKIYKNVVEESDREGKKLSRYLAVYNMTHLATLIEMNYYNDKYSQKIAKEIRSYDLSNSICEDDSDFNHEIKEWLLNDYYIKYFYVRINELKIKVVEHYNNSINGGGGSNNYISELLNVYVQLDQFLQQNVIINDCYKPYRDIVEMFIEAVFASYATHGENNSRINSVNSWVLSLMLKHARPKSITRLANRYKIKSIVYFEDEYSDDNVKDLIIRLFEDYNESYTQISNTIFEEPNHDYFREKYQRWQKNALQILALVDFEKEYLQTFTDLFIHSLTTQKLYIDPNEVTRFISMKADFMTEIQLRKIFHIGLKNNTLFNSVFWLNYSRICEKRKVSFKLTKTEVDELLYGKSQNRKDSFVLIDIYRCLQDDCQKNQIEEHLIYKLKEKFNINLWLDLVLHELISFESHFLDEAIDYLKPKDYSNSRVKPYIPPGVISFKKSLNEFINISFKNDVDLTREKYKSLKEGLTPYYKWLFDIEGFDYDKFDPKWIREYPTLYYYRRFGKSKKLKKHLETLLSEIKPKVLDELKQAYVDIFVVGR